MTRKVKKLLISALALTVTALLALSLCACGAETASGSKDGSSVADSLQKIAITVEITDNDGETSTLNISTDKTYLADALVDEGIVEYSSSGIYTTVNGITADFAADGAWWCVTKDGKMTTEGMNTLKLADGDKYEITYTK